MTEPVFKVSEWPSCPTCGNKTLVTGGVWVSCSSCSFIDNVSSMPRSPVFDQIRTRIASKGGGEEVIAVIGPDGTDFNEFAIDEVRVEISRRLIHEKVWRAVRNSLNDVKEFVPRCVMNFHRSDRRYLTLKLDGMAQLTIAQRAALSHDIVSVMWISPSPQPSGFCNKNAGPLKVGDRGFFNVNTHFYGGPTLAMSTSFRRDGNKMKFGNPVFHNQECAISSWCAQPVCWEIVRCVPGRFQPRFFSSRLFSGGTCINACLCEDLDGPVVASIAVRQSSESKYEVIPIEAPSVRTGIATLNTKVEAMDAKMLEQLSTPLWAKTASWPSDVDPRLVRRDIAALDVWKHVVR